MRFAGKSGPNSDDKGTNMTAHHHKIKLLNTSALAALLGQGCSTL